MAMQVKFPFGKLVSVLVTHVDETSGDFFLQISDEAGKLDALMAEIEQNVLSGRAKPPKASEIMVGCIYLVQYQEDSRWYRARVLGVNIAEDQCEVFFVDYGNTELVPLSCVRNAEDRFCELPPQSFECELENFDRFPGDRFEEMLTLLNDTILEQELYCKAVQLKKNCILVTQLFIDDKGARSVLDEMQSGGLGATTEALSNGHDTIPRQPNLKREVKYKLINLSPDSFHDLSVTWVEDPSHFWCQLLSNVEILEELMEKLADVYTNLEPAILPLQSCTVGYPCCAKFYEDDAWYRGIITNVSSIATGQIEVRFVDYGNTQNTELSDVKDLKDEFLKEPCQAMYFAIAGVDPASKDGLWAEEAKALFDKLIKFKHVVGLVTKVENDGRHRVKLMDTTSDLDMELNQILIAANYGVKSADPPTSLTSTVPATAFKTSEPVPMAAPPPVFAKENIQVGIEEKVLVTNIVTPGKFYCQLFKNGPKLENLMMEVGRHYSQLGANEELLSSPLPGDPCCAQFSEDGCWYRAVVLSTAPEGVTVLYIDYGNSETIPSSKIKNLIPKYSELPQQGIECTLNRIKPKFSGGVGEPKWRAGDTKKFVDLALEKEGKITVISQDGGGVCRVELVVRNRKEDQNMSEQLLIAGNAELADGALSASANLNNLKSQTFPKPDLEVGQFEDVIVSYTEHPCNFWCQLQKTATDLDSLMQEISELYSSEGQGSFPSPACGMLCCAQFTEDNKWYRGKITGIKKAGLVEVHFVDYGNYEMLPLSRIKKLQAEYLLLPPQAVKCALAKIDPLNKDLLSDDIMNRFEELTQDKELVMMADKFDESTSTFEVVLLDTTEGKNLDVAKDLQRIMGPSTNREAAHIVGVEIQPGTTERVFVSSATSPTKFSCQLMKTADSLDELMNQMFEHYDQLSAQQEQMPKPSVGEFCASKFTLDDGWYRAKVLEVQGDNVSVLYIDYGNSETLSLSRLKVLNSKFHSLPSQAIDCSLSGNFSGVADTQFQDLVSEKEFTAKILSVKSGVAVLDLVSKETNQSVANILSKEAISTTPSACTVANSHWEIGDAIDVFVPFVESAQKFFCQASNQISKLDALMIKLEAHYSNDSENLPMIPVGSCCAAWYSEGGWYRAKVEHVEGSEVKVNYIDYGDNATIPLSSIRTLKPEFSVLPAQAVPCCLKGFSTGQGPENFKDLVLYKEFKLKVISAKNGGSCEVDLVPHDGSATISQVLSKAVETQLTPSLSVPSIQWKLGDKVEVFIPFVGSAQKFFCQTSQSDLDDLMTRLEEHYCGNQDSMMSVSAGTFCVAQYEDGGWYRAQVTQVHGQSISVFYIDYGDTATLPLSSLRTLRPEFASLPSQAMKCCLKGCSTSKGPENFKDLVIEQEFEAQVEGVKGQDFYEVELVSKDGSTSISREFSKGAETTGPPSSCHVASIQWKLGDKVEVFVPVVESAQKFFCQAAQYSSDLDNLMIRLEEHYRSDQEKVTSVSAETFCIAQYEDGGWYRAQVTQVQGQSISVFYIDYGDIATIPLSSIRTLRPEFSSLPAQAVQCSLEGAPSSGGPENFKDLVLEQEFDLCVIASKQPGIYEVELVSKDGSQSFGVALPSETKIGTFPLAEMTEGSFVQLCPTACISPHLFHCQIATADHKGKLEWLMDQLQEYYEGLVEQEQCIANVNVGMNCAAVFADDGLWYRGKIVKILDQQMVEVFYLDFGNCESVPLSKVKTISADLLQLPAQAIQCSIPSISPVSGVEWPDVTVERFNNLAMHKKLLGKIIRKGNDNVEIELFDTSDLSVDINIGELLVKEGLACPGTPVSAKPLSAMKSLSDLGKTQVLENKKVYVTAVESPGCFFGQISGSEERVTSLMSEIASVYDSMSADELNINSISVGDVCCAQFSEDNQWYRAVVEENTANALTVRFIDYGNIETLPIDRTKVLKDAFFGEPPMAIKCGLHNVQPSAGETWPDKAGIFFEELTSEKELDAKFLSFTEPFLVQLSDNGADIGDELVKAQLAVAKPTSQGTSASEEYLKPVIKCGEMYDICITHMSSPGKFYCQLVNMSEQLDGMMNDLNSHYFQLSETDGCLDSPSVGQPCVALFEEMWYRAKILNLSGNGFTVHYVDYGNEETLKHSEVKKMTPLFFKTPQVAVECSLDLNRDQWSEEATALFEELTGENQLVIKTIGQQGDTYQVKVFDKDEQCISDKVYNTIAVAVQESQKEKLALKEMAVQSGVTEDIYVAYVKSSQEFYIHLSKTYDHLVHMMSEISRVYSNLADDVRPEDLLVGTPICAQFAEDGEWYRAVIESIPSDFEVGVRFVDYGNSDVVLLSDVRQLREKFCNIPIQAVRCCLDSQVDTQSFQQRVDDKELKATFLSLEGSMQWKVSLSDTVGKIGPKLDSRILEDSTDEFQIKEFIQPEVTPEMISLVYVSHVVSPDEFYVQFESSLDELSILSGKISEFYPRLHPSNFVLNDPCPGMSCCARFSEDGNWYRGKIERVGSTGALVQFVDYGNCEDVPFCDIKDPEKTFMRMAQQAIPCGLDATKDVWSAEEVNIFKTVALNNCFEARFIIRDGAKWRVCLKNNGGSIVDMFMTTDSAYHQQTGSEVLSVQTRTYTQQKLSSGQVEEVFVSHVTESGDFFVQLSKTSADLETIEILVSETYDQLGPTEEAMEVCFVDSLCCAKFSQDFKWYRAFVTKVFSEVEVEVLFVDYGNTDTLKVETVKQIKSGLLSIPIQAVKCHLEGSKEVWTENDVQQFEASVMDKPLHVTFTRQEGDTWFVTIQELDMFSSKTAPKVKSFSKEVFDCKKRENAYFVYADSPDCLWLQPERTGDALLALMDQIANDVTGQAMDKSQLLPRVPCLGQFTDNDAWHRAQILDVQDSNNVTVFYADYGNSESLTVDRLHPISDTHLKLPAQAICCHLADVQGVDPSRVTDYLNEVLLEKVVEVEVQDQHPDGSCTVKLYEPGTEQSINEQVVGECLGDTSLLEEAILEQSTPPRLPAAREKRAFKFLELKTGTTVPVSFVSAFLPAEIQLLLTERIEERDQIINSVTALYEALEENELKLENPEVGVLCCVHFSPDENEAKKWYRGEIISVSADETATVKLVDYGTHEKIQISDLKCLKDELLEMPVFFLESNLANICPSSEDGQWSPECCNILESLCRSKALTAEITQVSEDLVELILTDDSGKSVNQSLIDLGYAKACDNQDDFSGEEQGLKWPELQVGQCVEVFMMSLKDLQSIQLQLVNSEADLTALREQLTAVYSTLGEAEAIVGNPRVGQVCCAQFAHDEGWYRAVITCVSDAGVEVKFVDYGNMDVVLSIKQLREEFFILPVQCFECRLGGVKPSSDFSEAEIAAKLLELCEGKQLTAEVMNVSGDSVVVNLFDETGGAKESVADTLVKLGHALSQRTSLNEPRRLSVSEEGKIVYNYPEYGDVHNVSLISVNSPSDFWCQITNSETELKTLSEKIELFYQSVGENDLRLLCLQDKDICCAKFTEDDKWYRSLVNNVCPDGQVCVCAVDYSKQETLSLNRIKKLEAEFALLPVQSINCSLSNIEPPYKYYGEEWSSKAVERFKELCEGKDLKIKVRGREGDFTLVELLDSMSLSVADQLLSEQLAVERKSPLTVLPVKSIEKQANSLSADQVEKALEQSSEEDVFQEAESRIEGAENLADGKEDGEEEEEEFHDSTDQITTEEKTDTLTILENEQEGATQTAECSQEVPDVERKEVQDDEKVEEVGEKGLEQVAGEVPEEKPCPETGERQEDAVSKEEGTAEELESEVMDKEEKVAETEGLSSEMEAVSEQVEGELEETEQEEKVAETEGLSSEMEAVSEQVEGELEEETEQEEKGAETEGLSSEMEAVSEQVKGELEEEAENVDSAETAEESEPAGEEGEQELKMEEGHVTGAVSEEADDKAEKEIHSVESSETAEEPEKAGEEGEQELKMEEGHVTGAVSEEADDKAEKETCSVESSETAREEQEVTKLEESAVDGAEKDTDSVESSETAREEQEETKLEESPVASADIDETGDGAEKETDNVDNLETYEKEQGEIKEEECATTAVICEESGVTEVKETYNVDSLGTAREEQEEPVMEESPAANVTEQKDEGAEDQSEEFVEAQEGVTEAFSEDDLTAITGSAEDEVEAFEEAKSDEERVSSASPAYHPPSSPAVSIQPGGEVQFTKEQSPGKETQDS